MDVRIDKARADQPLKVSINMSTAKLPDDAVFDSNVALLGQKIVAVDNGSMNQNLVISRHRLKWAGNLFSSYLANGLSNADDYQEMDGK